MNKWIKSIFAGLIITGLVFLFYKKISPVNNGGIYDVHYVLGSRPGMQQDLSNNGDKLGDIPAIIKKRIIELGYNSILRITKNDNLDILVENVRDTNSLRRAVMQNNKMNKIEFREVYTLDELPALFPVAGKVAGKILAAAKRNEEGIYSIISPLAPDEMGGENVYRSPLGSVSKKDTVLLSRILHQPEVAKVVPAGLQFYYGILTDESAIRNSPDDVYLYGIGTADEKASIQNDDIESAKMMYSGGDQPGIYLQLNNKGAGKWARMTQKNTGRYIAMILDGIVTAAPKIYGEKPGRWIMMTGRFTMDEATLIAQQLNGRLPANDLAIIKEEIISKKSGGHINLLLLLTLSFTLAGGLALLIFNNLKSN